MGKNTNKKITKIKKVPMEERVWNRPELLKKDLIWFNRLGGMMLVGLLFWIIYDSKTLFNIIGITFAILGTLGLINKYYYDKKVRENDGRITK